ncbi:MAG: hypothetical protein WBN31_14420 [Gammaproteobacteria bacterium]
MKMLFKMMILGVAVALSAGCGGGGGGGNPPAAVVPDATISPQSAVEIAGEVVGGVQATGDFGIFGGAGLIGGNAGDSGLSKSSTSVLAAHKTMQVFMAAPFGPEVSQCLVSGSVSVSGNLASQDALTAGDRIVARFTNCDDGEGEVVNGTLTLVVDTFSGDLLGGFVTLGLTVTFQNFSVNEGGTLETVSGDLSLLMDTQAYPVSTFSISSGSLTVSDGVDTVVLSNFSTTVTSDESSQPPAFTYTSSGRISVPTYGSVSYQVRQPFTGFGEGDPDSGVLYIEGNMGGSITVTVLSNVQVQLDMDYDGDGVTDETIIVTWVELEG